jgi:hypothetical protein
MNITGVGIIGADSSDFAQINNCESSLRAAGSRRQLHCRRDLYTDSAGSRTASIAVTDTAPGSPQTASLAGAGLGPIADLSPNLLTFASQTVGTTSTPQMVTLTNTGTSALNITAIAASSNFGKTNTCNTSLAAGGNCQIPVTFTTTATGSSAGSITITDNAAAARKRWFCPRREQRPQVS